MPVEVVLTDRIRNAIEDVFRLDSATDELKNELRSWRRNGENSTRGSGGETGDHIDDVIDKNDARIPFKMVRKVLKTLKEGKQSYKNTFNYVSFKKWSPS